MDDISTGLSHLEHILDRKRRPGKLKLSVLSHITANFADEQKIGEGGCGHVYKGTLPSGKIVAVKKLLNAKTMDDRMFQQEVTSMMRVRHQNIVRFLGYCSHIEERAMKIQGTYILAEERERLLCLEYMSKGSLAGYISDELRGLEWHTRFEIIKGICKGLHYLHHNEKGIIHMDLKPLNILLDDNLVPKITDFGISRAGDITKTISQERVCSLGYCAPEYLFHGKISFKLDIYSLGVIITEIVTGNREEPNNAIVHRRWRHRWKKTSNDTTFIYQQQVTKCLELAQSCKNQKPTERPNIEDIIRVLNEMENTGRDISGATGSMVEQKNSFLVQMLEIKPLELHFSADLNKQVSHLIELTNYADDYVAFTVSDTSRLPFHIIPNKNVIPPRSSCSVTISLEALKKRLREEHCKAELCVQSARVDKGLTSQDITVDIFKEEPNKVVDTVNLTTSTYETVTSTPNSMTSSSEVSAVKFIARMQWVACGHGQGYIIVYSYVNDRLTEINGFQADEEGTVNALAVHPTLPYLLSSCKCNLVKLWDWDQGWICTRQFSTSSSTDRYDTREMTFNPKDASSFACLDDDGEIHIWSIDYSEGPNIRLRGDTSGMAYCCTASDLQLMATVGWQKGKIEILDLRADTAHVHAALEAGGLSDERGAWSLASHPTRSVLATAKPRTGLFLWNYNTYGLTKVPELEYHKYIKDLGFMDTNGFQRLVITERDTIRIVDISDSTTLTGGP